MDVPAAIALALIGAAVIFVISVNVFARHLVRGLVTLERNLYRPGDIIEGQLTINALRQCSVKIVRVTLICSSTNPQNKLRMSRFGWIYKTVDTVKLDREFAAGQSQIIPFALNMPATGEVPEFAFLGQDKTRYPGIWSVTAEIDCNGVIVSTGSVFDATNSQCMEMRARSEPCSPCWILR